MRCTRACVYIRASGVSPRNVPFKIAREPKRRTKARGDISRFFPSIRDISDQGGGEGREGCTYIEYCPWWQLSWNRDCSLLLLSFLFIYKLEISNKLEIRFGFEMFNSEQFEKFARAESFIFSAKRIIDVFYLEKFEGTWKTVHNLGKMFLKRD